MTENSELATALAKAQGSFPTINRTREVTVRTKTGGTYTFTYAPLDTILSSVRKPLADNGLAISQLLDGPDLVTVLLHSSGESMSGRLPIPVNDGETIQQFGSAITYLRRYAIQALLGIASEEDDDANGAAGNQATGRDRSRADAAVARQGILSGPKADDGLVGTAKAHGHDDFELRQTSDGWALPFRISDGRRSVKVLARDALAQLVAENRAALEDQTVTAWGSWEDKSFKKGDETIAYRVLNLTRLKAGALDLTEPEPDTVDADFEAGWLEPAGSAA